MLQNRWPQLLSFIKQFSGLFRENRLLELLVKVGDLVPNRLKRPFIFRFLLGSARNDVIQNGHLIFLERDLDLQHGLDAWERILSDALARRVNGPKLLKREDAQADGDKNDQREAEADAFADGKLEEGRFHDIGQDCGLSYVSVFLSLVILGI